MLDPVGPKIIHYCHLKLNLFKNLKRYKHGRGRDSNNSFDHMKMLNIFKFKILFLFLFVNSSNLQLREKCNFVIIYWYNIYVGIIHVRNAYEKIIINFTNHLWAGYKTTHTAQLMYTISHL